MTVRTKNEDEEMEDEESRKPKEAMLKLASSTQFGGPGYIVDSMFMTERLLWLFVFIAFTAFTIHDLYQTISGYIAGPTATDTTVRVNQTMSFDGATFCVSYNSMKLDWGVDLTKPEETMKVLNSFSGEDILAMLQNETQADTASNNTNLVSLIMLTTTMLGNIVRLENLRYSSMTEVDHYWGVTHLDEQKLLHVDNRTTESIERVYQFYVKRGVSLVELHPVIAKLILRQMFATFFCERITRGNREHISTRLYNTSQITWFGRVPFGLMVERLCFKLPDGTIMFRSSGEACVLKISPEAVYPDRKNPGIIGGVMFDLSGHSVPQGDATNMWGLSIGDTLQVDIQIMGIYTSLNQADVPCDDTDGALDNVDCMGKCRARKIYEMCKCWPLSWWYLPMRPSDARYCTQPKDTFISGSRRRVPDLTTVECNDTHYSYVIDDDCAANCKQKCRQSIFIYTQQKIDNTLDSPYNKDQSWENRTIIYMDTPSFVYPEITESWSFEIGKFFSDLGGNFSLWLGGSLIGVVHLIVYSCRVGVNAKYGREVKRKEAELRTKVKENVVERIRQQGVRLPPDVQRQQQQAFFRYALQHALRTYNTQAGGGKITRDRLNLASTEDEQTVRAIFGDKEIEAEVPENPPANETAILLKRLAELEKQLEEHQKRIASIEHSTGVGTPNGNFVEAS